MISCCIATRRFSSLINNHAAIVWNTTPAAYLLQQRGLSKIHSLPGRSFTAAAQRSMSTATAQPAGTSPPVHILLLGVHMNAGEPFTEEALISMIEGDVAKGAENGLTIAYQLTKSEEPDYQLMIRRLRERSWDAVAVGAGVRFPRERSALFEGLVNAVVQNVKPLPLLLFNSTPHGVVEAYHRAKQELLKIEK